jgi:hypothetical protein
MVLRSISVGKIAELPPRGISRFWRLYLPLVIDLCPVILAWIILPAQFDAPMEIIALSVPDVFVVIVILTMLSVGWMIARILLTLRPRRLTKLANHTLIGSSVKTV